MEKEEDYINIRISKKNEAYLVMMEYNDARNLSLPIIFSIGKTKLEAFKNYCSEVLDSLE